MNKSSATDSFWTEAKTTGEMVSGDDYWVRRLGANQFVVDSILSLVLDGEKRGTFGLKWLHERQPETAPELNGYAVLVDMNETPKAIIKTTQITPIAYKDITDKHLVIEGPGARALDRWRDIHWPYWRELLKPHDLEPTEEMLVMVEHFDLVFPKRA
ncbi:MAG: ASCH domain-containing protein [Rhodospirillaceae bacterium]